MALLRISNVSYQPHVVITHPDLLGSSLVLRIPESVRSPDGSTYQCPGKVLWEEVSQETHLRYRWHEDETIKAALGTDISGEVRAGEDEITFEVTMRNAGTQPHNNGACHFCLQAGANHRFQDREGIRTFVRLADRWVSIHEMEGGKFEDHRMCGYPTGKGGVDHSLMAKVGCHDQWVLGIALSQPGGVSCNLQQWPSCIHANPVWRMLEPGEKEVALGKVYLFRGTLDSLFERYENDWL